MIGVSPTRRKLGPPIAGSGAMMIYKPLPSHNIVFDTDSQADDNRVQLMLLELQEYRCRVE